MERSRKQQQWSSAHFRILPLPEGSASTQTGSTQTGSYGRDATQDADGAAATRVTDRLPPTPVDQERRRRHQVNQLNSIKLIRRIN